MSTQCFTTCGNAGLCLKHVPNISVNKTVYISGLLRDKSPKTVRAIETIARTPFSEWKILSEARKDQVMARARANATKKNQTRNFWLVSKKEREDYAGINNVMSILKFMSMVTCIDRSLTLSHTQNRHLTGQMKNLKPFHLGMM